MVTVIQWQKSVQKSQVGDSIKFTQYVKQVNDYDTSDENKMKMMEKEAFDRFQAYTYVVNSDQEDYGSLSMGLQIQFSVENEQYPKNYTDALNALSNHLFDPAIEKRKKKKNDWSKSDRNDKSSMQDKDDNNSCVLGATSFARFEGSCWCCGKRGHCSDKCQDRDKPKTAWAINKTGVMRIVPDGSWK